MSRVCVCAFGCLSVSPNIPSYPPSYADVKISHSLSNQQITTPSPISHTHSPGVSLPFLSLPPPELGPNRGQTRLKKSSAPGQTTSKSKTLGRSFAIDNAPASPRGWGRWTDDNWFSVGKISGSGQSHPGAKFDGVASRCCLFLPHREKKEEKKASLKFPSLSYSCFFDQTI